MAMALIFFLMWLPSIAFASDNLNVVVHNQRLFVGQEEYFIRGMCYNPAPIGYANSSGLCSPRLTPWGEWKSACYDSDFMDGSVTPGTGPSGSGGWFSKLWERDVPAMAAAGVNTIRLYNANAVTQTASVIYNGTRSIVVSGAGKEHRKFLDLCWSHGIRVIFPLLSDCNMYLSLDNDTIQWMLRNQIDEVGNHPAVLMYNIGNEWSLECTAQWQTITVIMGKAVKYARQYQYSRWQRTLPIMTSVLNYAIQFEYVLKNMPVDVFGVNSYEGARSTFTMPTLYAFYKPLLCKYGAALFISEFNPQSYSNAGYEYANGVPTYWQDFTTNADTYGIIGAAYFEWTNEPHKGSTSDDLGVMKLQAATDSGTGLSSVSLNAWDIVDNVIPKSVTLNSICCGLFNGSDSNFKTDTWSLMGRAPYSLDNVPAICAVDAPGYQASTTSIAASVQATAAAASTTTSRAVTSSASTTASTSGVEITNANVATATFPIEQSTSSAATARSFLCLIIAALVVTCINVL